MLGLSFPKKTSGLNRLKIVATPYLVTSIYLHIFIYILIYVYVPMYRSTCIVYLYMHTHTHTDIKESSIQTLRSHLIVINQCVVMYAYIYTYVYMYTYKYIYILSI